MNREESLRAMEELASSPAAKWIGNKLVDDGVKLLQKCMRCGTEQVLEMPPNMKSPADVPIGFDEKLYAWKKAFQVAHAGCAAPAPAIVDHAYLSAGDTAAASGDRPYTGCFLCGRSRRNHAA